LSCLQEVEQRVRELEAKYLNAETSAKFFKSALEEANVVNDRLTGQVAALEAERDRLKAEKEDK
jgi:hypothetical protein